MNCQNHSISPRYKLGHIVFPVWYGPYHMGTIDANTAYSHPNLIWGPYWGSVMFYHDIGWEKCLVLIFVEPLLAWIPWGWSKTRYYHAEYCMVDNFKTYFFVHSYRTCQTVSPKLNNKLFYIICFIVYIKYILHIYCLSRRF